MQEPNALSIMLCFTYECIPQLYHNTLWTLGVLMLISPTTHVCNSVNHHAPWRHLEQNVIKRNHGISWFSRYCIYYCLNKAYNRMSMKCTPGLSGSLKEKPFLEDRNKQEKKKRQEKGRKSTEKEKIKNRKGKLGKQSQCIWWQGPFTKTFKNQGTRHAASTVTKKANVNMLQVSWHRFCNDKLVIWPGWTKKQCVCASLVPPSLAPELSKLICSSWLGVALPINDLTVLLI